MYAWCRATLYTELTCMCVHIYNRKPQPAYVNVQRMHACVYVHYYIHAHVHSYTCTGLTANAQLKVMNVEDGKAQQWPSALSTANQSNASQIKSHTKSNATHSKPGQARRANHAKALGPRKKIKHTQLRLVLKANRTCQRRAASSQHGTRIHSPNPRCGYVCIFYNRNTQCVYVRVNL